MEQIKTFLITGFGRSGTKFLSEVMNKSQKWTVKHEARGDEDMRRIQPTHSLLQDFSQDYYGEVNSYLRYEWMEAPVDKYGFIRRDPRALVLSAANRNTVDKTFDLIGEIYGYLRYLDKIEENDRANQFLFYNFEDFTSSKDALQELLNDFNIDDVDVDQIDLEVKVNANKTITYPTFQSLPMIFKERCYELEK